MIKKINESMEYVVPLALAVIFAEGISYQPNIIDAIFYLVFTLIIPMAYLRHISDSRNNEIQIKVYRYMSLQKDEIISDLVTLLKSAKSLLKDEYPSEPEVQKAIAEEAKRLLSEEK